MGWGKHGPGSAHARESPLCIESAHGYSGLDGERHAGVARAARLGTVDAKDEAAVRRLRVIQRYGQSVVAVREVLLAPRAAQPEPPGGGG